MSEFKTLQSMGRQLRGIGDPAIRRAMETIMSNIDRLDNNDQYLQEIVNATPVFVEPIYNLPASLNVTHGGTPVGTVADMRHIIDGNEYNLPETNVNPGFRLEINFVDVPRILGIVARLRYEGSPTHYALMQMYNYTLSSDTEIIRFDSSPNYYYRTILMPNADMSDFINGSDAQIVLEHNATVGITSHDLFVDFIALLT